MWSTVNHVVRNGTAAAMAVCITATLGCKRGSARPPEHTGSSESRDVTSAMPSSGFQPSGTREASPAADCVHDPRVALRKLRDNKPELSDLRNVHTHAGVLIFDIRIDTSGSVADVRLAKPVDQQAPWPTLAERWRKAISDWRYEPPTLDHEPVAVCLTVTVRVEVI